MGVDTEQRRGPDTGRVRRVVEVPASDALGVLEALQAALTGEGPVIRPVDDGPSGATGAGGAWGGDRPDVVTDDPADPAVAVITTSGSTGRPRGVLLCASAMLASASATHDRLGGPGRWLLALPLTHVAGLQVLVRGLVARTAPVALPPGPFTADAFADAAQRRLDAVRPGSASGSRVYTALVPTQLTRILAAGGRAVDLLARHDAVLLGGAAAPPELLRRAAEAGVRTVRTYGMTETCGGCVYDGRPLDGVRVEVEDPDPDGAGRLVLSGPVVARGYVAAPQRPVAPGAGAERDTGPDTGPDEPFGVDDRGRRRFRTNDLGRIDEGGTLHVLGRIDDVIVTGGLKVMPGPVERIVAGLPGVAEVVVVGVPDREWGARVVVALVPAPGGGGPPSLEELRSAVAGALGPAWAPRQRVVLDELPTRGPGKPDRARVAAIAAGAV